MTGTEDERRARQQEVTAVVLKIVGVAVAIGLVIGIGAWLVVKGLGLDAGSASGSSASSQPITPLPTTALPVPTSTPTSTATPGVLAPTTPSGGLLLSASPVLVQPMERINLTGQWPGHDNQSLMVQQYDGGQWTNFGVQVQVNVGTFETYVMTAHTGDQKFRVFDPTTHAASNAVTVTVGS